MEEYFNHEVLPHLPKEGKIIFYTTPDGAVHLEVFFKNESFWLSQKKMAEKEYEKFRVTQDIDYESDFDREIQRLKSNNDQKNDV